MITISRLKMSFGKVTALNIDELTVSEGEHHALIGSNGAGKSTLLMVLAGLLQPSSGRARIAGTPVGSIDARAAVSFVPDQPALFDDLTLDDQLHYVARLYGNAEPADTCLRLIEALNGDELLMKFPRSMSKGQRQKAGLLVATARPFDVLLLDEPTTALDAESRTALIHQLSGLAEQGMTVVCSTHDDELIDATDSSTTLTNGRIITESPPPDETID